MKWLVNNMLEKIDICFNSKDACKLINKYSGEYPSSEYDIELKRDDCCFGEQWLIYIWKKVRNL